MHVGQSVAVSEIEDRHALQYLTVVLLTDDGDLSTAPSGTGFPSEVYVYIGEKAKAGHPIEQAGLTSGTLYGVQVILNGSPVSEESDLFGLGTAAIGFIGKANFKLVNLGDVSNFSPRELEDMSIAANITRFRRPEDSAWDPRRGEKHRKRRLLRYHRRYQYQLSSLALALRRHQQSS